MKFNRRWTDEDGGLAQLKAAGTSGYWISKTLERTMSIEQRLAILKRRRVVERKQQ